MIILNGHKIKPTIFPDKTSQIWKLPNGCFDRERAIQNVFWYFENEAELIHLHQLVTLLDSLELSAALHIDYLPYGRQDKMVSNETTFALHSFAKIINGMQFESVTCTDPHSEEAAKLIDGFKALYPTAGIEYTFKENGYDIACYPDKGAVAKYTKLYSLPYINADKVRDQLTGAILGLQVSGDVEGKKILIIDDICDGGMTFQVLARQLYAKGAKQVDLYVSHGLFTKGTQVLTDAGIVNIYTSKMKVI